MREIRCPCPACVGPLLGTESILLPQPMQPLLGDSGIRIHPQVWLTSDRNPSPPATPSLFVEKKATHAARRGTYSRGWMLFFLFPGRAPRMTKQGSLALLSSPAAVSHSSSSPTSCSSQGGCHGRSLGPPIENGSLEFGQHIEVQSCFFFSGQCLRTNSTYG